MWTLYERPKEFPSMYVLREWIVTGPGAPLQLPGVFLARDIEVLRSQMIDKGLTCLPRSVADDPSIVECWI
jgi:hypothetical protein